MPTPDSGNPPLFPYTVLDLTEGGFNWCGKVLADLGADVIKIEPPGGSPTREIGPFVDGIPGPDRSLFWASYCLNKRSVTVDLSTSAGKEQFRELSRNADILIESNSPGVMDDLGLGYENLGAENPGLVYTSITPFGQTGPYAQYLAPDLVAWSMGGMQYICGDADRSPVRISAPQAELNAAGQAAAGTMAAFWSRQRTGQGQHVDVSMQTAVIWTLMNATPFPPLHGVNQERDGAFRSRGPLAVRQVFECQDGFVSALMAPSSVKVIAEWMAEENLGPPWFHEIDWDSLDIVAEIAADAATAVAKFNAVQHEVEEFFLGKTKNELYLRAIDHKILLAPCHTVEDIASSEQLEARNFWHNVEYPNLNRKLRHLGPYIKFGESPIRVRRPAPGVGQHNEEILGSIDTEPSETRTHTVRSMVPKSAGMPFDGLKVLDFTWVGVGPITIKHLGDFGADVIRVESVTRPDVLRNAAPFKDATPGINRSQFSANYNSSKRGLGLNLATQEGRDLALGIIEEWQPDIIAESFTPRVMKEFGLSYEDIVRLVPDVIYFSTCQQGQTGPHAKYAGFGQLAGALAGFYHITGWPDREPAGPYGAYSDFVNPPNAVAAIVAALEYRRRTGKGQLLDLSQYECATHYLAPAIMDYTTNGNVLSRRGNEDSLSAPHNVYRCADKERDYTGVGPSWIAIAVTDDGQWHTLCDVMSRPELKSDARSLTVKSRRQNAVELDEIIGAWTRDKDAHRLMESLQEAGVAAGAVQSQTDLWEDPQLQHRGFFQWLDHAECGPMPYDGLTYHLSKTPGALRMPQALIGQHNAEILTEILGMDDDTVADLVVSGVLESS